MNFQIVELSPITTSHGCIDAMTLVAADFPTYDGACLALAAYEKEDVLFTVYAIISTSMHFPINGR